MNTNGNLVSKPKKSCCLGTIIWGSIVYLFRTAVLVILIVVLAPPIYFAWRAGQPMELPQFGGKTFYQIQAERQEEYSVNEAQWQLMHHGEYPMHSKGMCYRMEIGFILVVVKPMMDYGLILHIKHPNEPYYHLPANVHYHSLLDYLPASWTLFEMGALNLYQFIPQDPMAAYGPNRGACIIPPPNCSPATR
ncbi:MAG: hypothetical protein ABSB41_08560 [Anaerolineales bacterium]|jgi:hypothetical protein